MSLAASLNQKLQTQIDRLDDAVRLLQTGAIPDLAQLQGDVNTLCSELLAAPGQDSHQAAEKMREMIGLLEHLAGELKTFQTDLHIEETKK